jgi:hypothetical protein
MWSNQELRSRSGLLGLTLLCLGLTTCGGGNGGDGNGGTPSPGGTGTLVLFAEDQPSGDALHFRMELISIVLTSSSGTTVTAFAESEKLEFEWRHLTLAPTVIKVATVPAATYTSVAVRIGDGAIMTRFNPASGTFPAVVIPAQTSTVTLPLNLTVNSGQAAGLRLDFDLRDSVQTDSTGALFLNPRFQAVPVSFAAGGVPGYVDSVLGGVGNLDLANNRITVGLPGFANLQQVPGPSFTVQADSNTRFETIASLADLTPGQPVEVDARLQPSGTFLAQEIKRDTVLSGQKIIGMVISRTPATGPATAFSMSMQQASPAPVAVGPNIFGFSIDASTRFRISTEDLPSAAFPNLNFDPQTLHVGQTVYAVHRQVGPFPPPADVVTLGESSFTGRVGPSVGPSGFEFVPDGDFYAANGLGQISVRVTPVTEFENLPGGLANLQANQSIVSVRGVLVFDAGTGVLVAKRVRLHQP